MNLQTSAPPKIAVISLDGDQKPRPLYDSRYAQGSPKFSPDGRHLAYCTNESGRPQVYVRAFPGPGATVQVSSEGGTDPVWRRDGRELFYRNGDSMMAVPVAASPDFVNGRPQQLWKGSYSHGTSGSCGAPGLTSSNYDVTPDGLQFLMVRDEDVEKEPRVSSSSCRAGGASSPAYPRGAETLRRDRAWVLRATAGSRAASPRTLGRLGRLRRLELLTPLRQATL